MMTCAPPPPPHVLRPILKMLLNCGLQSRTRDSSPSQKDSGIAQQHGQSQSALLLFPLHVSSGNQEMKERSLASLCVRFHPQP